MTKYQLRERQYDLAFNPNQPRDREGKWTSGGRGALRGLSPSLSAKRVGNLTAREKIKNAAKMHGHGSRLHEQAVLRFGTKQDKDEYLGRGGQQHPSEIEAKQTAAVVKAAEVKMKRDREGRVADAQQTYAKKGGSKHAIKTAATPAQIKAWHANRVEREEMLEALDDPYPELDDAELFDKLHGDDPFERKKALLAINARRDRYAFLAKTAHNGLRTAKAKETVAKWDARVMKVPGGKGFLRLRDRILTEKTVIGTTAKVHKAGEVLGELGAHVAVGSAIIGLAGAAAGLYSMYHGGDPHAFEAAQHAIEGWLHGGPKLGAGIPLNEVVTWVGLNGAIVGAGRKAAKANPFSLIKRARRGTAKAGV